MEVDHGNELKDLGISCTGLEVSGMITFYDLQAKCWFLNVNGKLGYVPDPDLVWDTSLAGFIVMHKDYLPGRDNDEILKAKLGNLRPLRLA